MWSKNSKGQCNYQDALYCIPHWLSIKQQQNNNNFSSPQQGSLPVLTNAEPQQNEEICGCLLIWVTSIHCEKVSVKRSLVTLLETFFCFAKSRNLFWWFSQSPSHFWNPLHSLHSLSSPHLFLSVWMGRSEHAAWRLIPTSPSEPGALLFKELTLQSGCFAIPALLIFSFFSGFL